MSKEQIDNVVLKASSGLLLDANEQKLLIGHVLDLRTKAQAFDDLHELMGYVQDGSDNAVWLDQDDATYTYLVRIGSGTSGRGLSLYEWLQKQKQYTGRSLIEAIQLAKAAS